MRQIVSEKKLLSVTIKGFIMGYAEEMRRLVDYVTEDGEIIELTPNRDNEKIYYQELEVLSNYKRIAIRYPGYKTKSNRSDYCVYLVDEYGEHPISHVEIMNDLYQKTTPQNYELMKQFVEAVALYGKDIRIPEFLYEAEADGFTFEELTSLMFYISIQEDINYPMPRYMGRTMCYFRYLEAVYCKVNSHHLMEDAIEKATRRYGPPAPNWNDVGNLYNNVARIRNE